MTISKNVSGRKNRSKKHRLHPNTKDNQQSEHVESHIPGPSSSSPHQQDPKEPDRARHARSHRKHARKNDHRKERLNEINREFRDDSPENDGDYATDEEKVIEDPSMAVLANAMRTSSPNVSALSSAASVSSNTTHTTGTTSIGSSNDVDDQDDRNKGLKEWIPHYASVYGYSSLFRFASVADYTLMVIGTIAAIVAGFCIPAIIYLFGNLIRTKVLADKMNCKIGSSSACDVFLSTCEENTIDQSRYFDKVFLERPLPLDNTKITIDHMKYFAEIQLSITFAYCISSSIYFFCFNYASQNQGGKLRRAYFQSLLQKDMTWFDTRDDPDSINRNMENTRRIVEVIGECIPVALSLTIMCCLCVGLAFWHGWKLTMVCLSTLPIVFGTIWLTNYLKAARILKERRAYRVAHELAKEVFSKMRTVISYSTQLTERAMYKREIARGNRFVIRAIFLQSLSVALGYFVQFGLWAAAFWYGMSLVMADASETCTDLPTPGIYDAGDMFVIVMCILFGCGNFYIVVIVVRAARVAKLCCQEVLKVIDGPNGVDNMSSDGTFLEGPLMGKVEFIDVRFTYPGNKRGLSLNNLSFVADPGTLVAIVGLSDSGKSTTLKLICKEYLADSGFIEIDGHDIRTLNTKWLRAHIGYIPQELTLFDMTIEDNVRMGKLDANFFQIQDACMKAGAHDFIISFKDGYQTKIGHKGNRLTPGQKQQLAIARALVREPKLLLLDEPTYALDSHSVVEFMRSLQKISKDRTVILVAHRLATVVHANVIYVLKNGKVVEKGGHQQLIKSKGPYHQLCMINRTSKSYHPGGVKIEGFDTSEMTIISCIRTFSQKPIIPSLYNTGQLSIDPVVSKVTSSILSKDKDTERGFHAKLEWTLEDSQGLPDTDSKEDDRFGRGLQENVSSHNLETSVTYLMEISTPASAKASSLTRKRNRETIAEEYRSISILNNSKKSWLRVLSMGSTSPWLILCGVISTIFLSIGIPFFGYIMALIIDILSDLQGYPRNWRWSPDFDKMESFLVMITISIAALGLYLGVFAFIQDLCLNLAAYMSVQKMRRFLYGCILNQDISFFEEPTNTPIALASILFQDTDAIRHVTLGVYATLIQCICIFIVALTLCLLHTVELTGYTLLFVVLIMTFNLADGWLAKKQHGKTIYALQQMSKLILQVFQSKHVITVCQMEPHFLKEFTTLQRKSLGTNKSLSCVRIFTYGISQSAVYWGFGMFLNLGIDRIDLGSQSFLDIMINVFVVLFGLITLGANLSIVMGFKHITKSGTRMLEIINRKPLIAQDDGIEISEDDCTKDIEYVNAHFWRPSTPDSTLLKGINLKVLPMQVTAIVGYPESGKSAYLELLGRFFDATGGLLTIAGKDIRYFSANSLRQHLSVIPKDPELFSRTVAQNIALGATFRRRISMEEVIQAAKEAGAHNLIVSLPEGYETRVGGDHDYLSTAQKQKISIARALLKNPKIMIFDEVTSLLDRNGETAILESISNVKQKRTVIMISHRIQPVQDADWIVVMEKGYLEEQGKHDDLLKRRTSSIYAQMWRAQNPMQDENFLKGNISYLQDRGQKQKSKMEVVPPPPPTKKRVGINESPSKIPTPSPHPPSKPLEPPPPADDEPEATPMCGGFFSFLGLGIVEEAYGEINDGEESERDRQNK